MAIVKKKWIKIIGPKLINNFEIGETIVSDPSKLIGKKVEVNVGFIQREMRKQHMKLDLTVSEIKGNQALTEVVGYNIVKAHLKRGIRKRRSKIEESFIALCKDNVKIRIKPFLITKYLSKRSVLSKLRKDMKEFILSYCKRYTFLDLIKQVTMNGLQKDLKKGLKKVVPVAFCDIKDLKKI